MLTPYDENRTKSPFEEALGIDCVEDDLVKVIVLPEPKELLIDLLKRSTMNSL